MFLGKGTNRPQIRKGKKSGKERAAEEKRFECHISFLQVVGTSVDIRPFICDAPREKRKIIKTVVVRWPAEINCR